MTDSKKIALIVGGNGGIGSHLSKHYANSGYYVVSTYNRHQADGSDQYIYRERLDPCNEESIGKLVKKISLLYGKLDVMVYAAGIYEDSLTEKTELENWKKVIETDLTGAFLVSKHVIPLLRNSRHGRILYIGSVMGESGCYGSSSYAAAKAGLIGLAKSIALENAKKGITANVLSLGYISTGMTDKLSDKVRDNALGHIPMHSLGDPDQIGEIAVDLCKEHTDYLTGQVIRVNGGLYV